MDNTNIIDIIDNTIFFFQLCQYGDIDGVKENIQDITNLNQHNDLQYTPLTLAIWSGNNELVKYLIEQGADVNFPSRYGKTPLMTAVEEGSIPIVRTLLENDAHVNDTDDDGDNALIYAIFYCNEFPLVRFKDNHCFIIQLLITCGIDIYHVNSFGFSMIDNLPDHVRDEIESFHNSWFLRYKIICFRIQRRSKDLARQKIWEQYGLNEIGL